MRIVRTETYVDADKSPFGQGARRLEGFAAAWVTKPSHSTIEPDPRQLTYMFEGTAQRPRWRVVGYVTPDEMERFLPPFVAISLRNFPRPRSVESYFNIRTSGDTAVDYIISQPVVIEHSPPDWVQLLEFLKGASPALILSAYFIGVRKTSLLLLARIVEGYILLSSAMVLSRWLEDGQFLPLLNQLFQR